MPAGLIASMAAASGVSDVVYLLVIAPISAAIFISPAVLTLLVTAIFVLRRESRIVTEQLQPEMQAGPISPDEYRSLTSIRRRLGAQWRTVTVRGIGPWWALRDFQQVTSELAFRKWHASRGETPKRAQKGTSESDYRRRIVELRARL